MFLVNSRLGHFSAPYSRRVPFSRSYGVNLPSSLAMIHSSTLGSSPHPPVSVYGTGRDALDGRMIFSQVCLPALSALPKLCGTVGFQSPYALQRGLPSPRGCVTPRSHAPLHHECRNINRLFNVVQETWGFRCEYFHIHCRYLCLHFLFQTLQQTSRFTFNADWNAPLPRMLTRVQSFGGSLDARSSSMQLRSTSELLRTL